jgi:transcriptional regulator with XRE-family HTH domain
VLRQRAGLTQRELALHLGVSVRTLAHWEAGSRPVPMSAVRLMARILRCTVHTVLAATERRLPVLPHPGTWQSADLPRILVALRYSAGTSAAALGGRVGVSGSTVRSWETGRSLPSASACQRLELVYGLPRDSLTRLRGGLGRNPVVGAPLARYSTLGGTDLGRGAASA